MAVIKTYLNCELSKAVKVQYLDGNLFSQDNQANQIIVNTFENGEPITLTGTVSASIVRADGGTVAATGGTISGNTVSITLPSAAYLVPGVVSIAVKVTASGVVTTIAAIVANMYQSSTDTPIDPGTIIPSIQTLIAAIDAAVASIPADYSSLWTKLAPTFSTDVSYVAGQYVTYNSGLYRFIASHTGEWSANDVTAVTTGGEFSYINSAIFNRELTLYPFMFYTKIGLSGGGATTDWDNAATTYAFTINSPIYIYVEDDTINIRIKNGTTTSDRVSYYQAQSFIDGKICIYRRDGNEVANSDLAKVHVITTQEGEKQYIESCCYRIEQTQRVQELNGTWGIKTVSLSENADKLGMITQRGAYRSTTKPLYSDRDIDLWIGRNGNITAKVFMDNEVTEATWGKHIHIPAGKKFGVQFKTSVDDYSTNYQTGCFVVVDGSDPTDATAHTMCYEGSNPPVQSAFLVGNKIITMNWSYYSIHEGSTELVIGASLGHDCGHANQCNYDNGKCYISDWNDTTLIHVFDFDDEENTLTYEKDITIPIPSDHGRVGYYVFDNEKQIFFMGYQYGDYDTEPNTISYGLYVKTTTGYQLAWERFASRNNATLNGFTLQGNYIYFVDNLLTNNDFKTRNVNRINLLTGVIEYNGTISAITSKEGEAIMPIGEKTFLVVEHLGDVFLVTFKEA